MAHEVRWRQGDGGKAGWRILGDYVFLMENVSDIYVCVSYLSFMISYLILLLVNPQYLAKLFREIIYLQENRAFLSR